MKTCIMTCAYSSLLAALLTTCAMAQEVKPLPAVVVTSGSNVNEKIIHSFKGSFKDAIDPIWYRLDKNYLVKFIMNEQRNTALLSKNGRLIYNISYGFEKDLPIEISDLINGSYEDYKIQLAIHVNENNRSIWVVNLEGFKKLIVVRVENGELEEVGNYLKS